MNKSTGARARSTTGVSIQQTVIDLVLNLVLNLVNWVSQGGERKTAVGVFKARFM